MRGAVLTGMLAAALGACVIDAPHYIMIDDDDANDASPDAGPCFAGCDGDDLTTCDNGKVTITCPLGCDDTTSAGRCYELIPSNEVTLGELDEVTAGLTVPGNSVVTINTSSGLITVVDEIGGTSIIRASGSDVVSGIRFSTISGPLTAYGVISVDFLAVDYRGTLTAVGTAPLIVLSRGDVTIRGAIDLDAKLAIGGVCLAGNDSDWSCPGPGGGLGAVNNSPMATGCGIGFSGSYQTGETTKVGGGGGAMGQRGGNAGLAAPGEGYGGGIVNCPPETLSPLGGGSGGGGAPQGGTGSYASGGAGGGAIQITSLTQITFSSIDTVYPAFISVGGAGGERTSEISDGDAYGGGGGGGSGGAVLLEAPTISIDNAGLFAGGGGGGTGSDPAGTGGAPVSGDGMSGAHANAGAEGGYSVDANLDGQGGRGGYVDGNLMPFEPANGHSGTAGTGSGGGGGGMGRLRINVRPGHLAEALFVPSAVRSTGLVEAE